MKFQSFSNLNAYNTGKLAALEEPAQGDPSLLKVFQHALSYAANGFSEKLIKDRLYLPEPLLGAYYTLRKAGSRQKMLKNPKPGARILILEPGIETKGREGKTESYYFSLLKREFPTSAWLSLSTRDHCPYPVDLNISDLQAYSFIAPDSRELKLRRSIQRRLRQAERSGFTREEMAYARSAMHIFFEEYHRWYQFLKEHRFEACFFITHYHKEGIIAALNDHGISSVEFQHGLISENDLYYVYPQALKAQIKGAFFPEYQLLFGPYWMNILSKGAEFSLSQTHVVGDYTGHKFREEKAVGEKENFILIAAQKNMGDAYIPYAENLLGRIEKQYPDWTVGLKLHPLEKDARAYEVLKKHPHFRLYGNDSDLSELLRRAKIQISIYSTTFYDALGLGTLNLSLQEYSSSADYAASMVKDNIAWPLYVYEDPIETYGRFVEMGLTMPRRESIYAPFERSVLFKILNSHE